jgi:hypothetical protein
MHLTFDPAKTNAVRALESAFRSGDIDQIQFLMSPDMFVHFEWVCNLSSLLINAIWSGNKNIIEHLIGCSEKFADIIKSNNELSPHEPLRTLEGRTEVYITGASPLQAAARLGRPDIIECLVETRSRL